MIHFEINFPRVVQKQFDLFSFYKSYFRNNLEKVYKLQR
ncbi:hypothetical protein LEP1GSC021_0535 [Leptospira noguchii str. 1993005606]|uniref:SLEI domain protein, PF07620 family n=1 Tax=Leptospira noguchii str. 2007001578 TaxID=1049974 RepID=A0ABP2T530_9LEPT|nr:hypothetical protein LEP1GSC035_1125 [Leptospira noguchii str. 2007001578]EPE82409.1 hypothetical protein LEP1GSC021_0535 [Leptospira noguchii str. 1993005606]